MTKLKEIKAGIIALLAIIGFVLMFQFMKGKSFFTTDNVYFAKYDMVDGLEPSSPVTINGLKVGQIEKIIPNISTDGKVHFLVQMLVDNKFSFSKKSTVEIYDLGLMSGKALRINLVYDKTLAKNKDTLSGNYKLSMMDNISSQVEPVKVQLENVLKKVDSLSNNANKVLDGRNRAEIAALLSNLNRTVTAFEGTSKNANSLMSNSDTKLQKVLNDASVTMKTTNNAVDKYGKLAENINTQKLNNTIADLDVTLGKLNTVIEGIQNGNGSLGKLTKDEQLYNNLEQTTKNLNELIVDLKENPKKYINISVFGKK